MKYLLLFTLLTPFMPQARQTCSPQGKCRLIHRLPKGPRRRRQASQARGLRRALLVRLLARLLPPQVAGAALRL